MDDDSSECPEPIGADRSCGNDGVERLEIALLLDALNRRYGYDFRGYAQASLQRRVIHAMGVEGVSTISELQSAILHTPGALERFLGSVSVQVTSMFRDPEVFAHIREVLVPLLRTYPFLRIWNAGCSTGEEVYSLAILLAEANLLDRCRLYATDISAEALDRAKKGIYPLASMQSYTRNYIAAGFEGQFSDYYQANHAHAILREDLRRRILFSRHNLVTDGSFNDFQLILCRNVMIYFGDALQLRVHGLFLESLSPLGYLVLGKRESLRHPSIEAHYTTVSPSNRIYRRRR